jgi:hypothetical protein
MTATPSHSRLTENSTWFSLYSLGTDRKENTASKHFCCQVDFKGFWRWYMTFRTTGFLDFVHRPVFRCPSVFQNTGRWTKSKNPAVLNFCCPVVIRYRGSVFTVISLPSHICWWLILLNYAVIMSQYCHVSQWLERWFELVIGFINHLQVVTTNNYYTIAYLHNLQSLHTNLLSLFPVVYPIRFLATD